MQGEEHVAPGLTVLVPAKTTWHEVDVHDIGLPPSFLTERAIATGAPEELAFNEAPTIVMLEVLVALLTRL